MDIGVHGSSAFNLPNPQHAAFTSLNPAITRTRLGIWFEGGNHLINELLRRSGLRVLGIGVEVVDEVIASDENEEGRFGELLFGCGSS
nr:hypothetical protein Iba_chr11cCG0340 [Ipomoea batatas]